MEFLLRQIYTFLIMFGFGAVVGLIFNLYQLFRAKIRISSIWTNFIDLFLGLLMGTGAFFVLIYANQGELRFYVFLAVIAGLISYFFFIRILKLFKR